MKFLNLVYLKAYTLLNILHRFFSDLHCQNLAMEGKREAIVTKCSFTALERPKRLLRRALVWPNRQFRRHLTLQCIRILYRSFEVWKTPIKKVCPKNQSRQRTDSEKPTALHAKDGKRDRNNCQNDETSCP